MLFSEKLKEDLLIFFIILIYLSIVVLIPKYLKEKKKISKFMARKIIHSFAGLTIFSTPYFNQKCFALIIAILMTILTRKSSKNSSAKPLKELYEAISEKEELKYGYLQGPFAYALAITIVVSIFLFFPEKYYFPITAILIMMYADTMASIIGKRFGKHHIKIPGVGDKRTLEGSLTFLIVSFLCGLFTFNIIINTVESNTNLNTQDEIIQISIIMAIISSILELLSPSKYDDIIVPIGTILLIIPIAILMKVW